MWLRVVCLLLTRLCVASLSQSLEQDVSVIEQISGYPPLTFVMYFTPNIADYSACTSNINKAYANYHNSSLVVIDKDSLALEWDTNDVRWNKVIVLHHLLHIHPENDVLIWLDSDLIINHLNFSFTSLLSAHASSDILISAEVNPKNGVINTGCMVLRNTLWTREFINLWWTSFNRHDGMDQHMFTMLYNTLPNARQHITILPANAINNAFPGLMTYTNFQPILHLAGESNFIRKHVFCSAWQRYQGLTGKDNETVDFNAQSHHSASIDVPERAQTDFYNDTYMFVTREELDDVDYIHLHQGEWDAINATIHSLLATFTPSLSTAQRDEIAPSTPSSDMKVILSSLQGLRYRVRDVQQSASKVVCLYTLPRYEQTFPPLVPHADGIGQVPLDDSTVTCQTIKKRFSTIANDVLFGIYSTYEAIADDALAVDEVPSQRVGLIQSALDSGLEFLLVCTNPAQYTSVMMKLEEYIHNLLLPSSVSILHPSSMPTLHYYKFKILEFKANYLHAHPGIVTALMVSPLQIYIQAWHVWCKLNGEYNYYGAGNTIMNSYEEGLKVGLSILQLALNDGGADSSQYVYDGVASVVIILQDILFATNPHMSLSLDEETDKFVALVHRLVDRKVLRRKDVTRFFNKPLLTKLLGYDTGEKGYGNTGIYESIGRFSEQGVNTNVDVVSDTTPSKDANSKESSDGRTIKKRLKKKNSK